MSCDMSAFFDAGINHDQGMLEKYVVDQKLRLGMEASSVRICILYVSYIRLSSCDGAVVFLLNMIVYAYDLFEINLIIK